VNNSWLFSLVFLIDFTELVTATEQMTAETFHWKYNCNVVYFLNSVLSVMTALGVKYWFNSLHFALGLKTQLTVSENITVTENATDANFNVFLRLQLKSKNSCV
jgi:hypothetical protein